MNDTRKAIDVAKEKVIENQSDIAVKWAEECYTKSIVAYIDVCGIRNLLMANSNDFNAHKQIYMKMDEIVHRCQTKEWIIAIEKLYGNFPVKYTILSDSIVLSVDASIHQAFDKMTMMTSLFITSLLELNPSRFMRGAITVGNLYHKNNTVFGPALVEAVSLEEKYAINFRCIMKKNHFDDVQIGTNNKLKPYFKLDDDGFYSLDYLFSFFNKIENASIRKDEGQVKAGLNILFNTQSAVKNELNKPKKRIWNKGYFSNRRVRKKYIWMLKYFRDTWHIALNYPDGEFVWLKDEYQKWKNRYGRNSSSKK